MTQWEFKYEDIQDYMPNHDRVFDLGKDGWELVSVFPWKGEFQGEIRFYFKRPIPPVDPTCVYCSEPATAGSCYCASHKTYIEESRKL